MNRQDQANQLANNHNIEKQALVVEPIRPITEVLKQIKEEDTELASRAARLVGCVRHLWETCD